MRYLFLVCFDPTEDVEETPGGLSIDEWLDEMHGRGARIDGERLSSPGAASTVRRRGGKTIVTDGPFAETKEVLAGYDIIEAADLDEAIEIAAKHPVAGSGMIEIRPFWVD